MNLQNKIENVEISKNEIGDIIFNTLTTFIPFLYFSLPIIIKILIPIILIMIPIGLIKLNWIENNQKKFFNSFNYCCINR